ncbi:MAG: phosphatidate cytidylyltransferase [Syntrophobacteraceae bacterium]
MPGFNKLSSHALRWVTGLLIGVPVLACFVAGPSWIWFLLISAVAAIGLWEFHGLLFPEPLPANWRICSYMAGFLLPLGAYLQGLDGLNTALLVSIFAAFCLMMLSSPLAQDSIPRVALLSLAWLYLPFLLSFVLLVGMAPQGRFWILFVMAVVVTGDAGAYHTGMKFGRHKLYETVSPKKTIEGAIGGLVCSMLAGTIFGIIFLRNVPAASLLVLSCVVALTGQVGDLIESMIKRNSGKKDSSGLLPGHGGVLDRLDSLLFAFPVIWFLLKWVAPDH